MVSARIEPGPVPHLDARLDLRLSARALDGLERGVPIVLDVRLVARGDDGTLRERRRLTLRHLPLAQRYLLEGIDAPRSFERRTQLLAALDRLRFALPEAWRLAPGTPVTLDVALDRAALPGPLRIPAWFSSDWRLAAQGAWTVAG